MADYCIALSQILTWVRTAIELRIHDVNARRRAKLAAKELREEAIEAEEERLVKREKYVEDKKEDHEKRMADEKAARI